MGGNISQYCHVKYLIKDAAQTALCNYCTRHVELLYKACFCLYKVVNKVTQYCKLFERTTAVVFHTSTVNVGAAAAAAAAAVAVVAADVAGGTAGTAACACRPRAKGGIFIHLRQRHKRHKP